MAAKSKSPVRKETVRLFFFLKKIQSFMHVFTFYEIFILMFTKANISQKTFHHSRNSNHEIHHLYKSGRQNHLMAMRETLVLPSLVHVAKQRHSEEGGRA